MSLSAIYRGVWMLAGYFLLPHWLILSYTEFHVYKWSAFIITTYISTKFHIYF